MFVQVQIIENIMLIENIVDTFCLAQIWYDLSILGMFTVIKSRGQTNFVLSKTYEWYYRLIHNLVHFANISRDLSFKEREKSMA